MRMRLGALLLGVLGFFACTSAALADKRVALVLGNSSYRNVAQLPNPVRDADAMAGLLRASGFDVVEVRRDLAAGDMRRVIRDFSDAARDADMAVVFYAGHGIEVDGANYLVPIDAKLERDIDVEDEAVSLDRVLRMIEPARRLRLIILDACRDNPFLKTMKRTIASRSVGRGLAEVEPTTSDTLIAFAAKAGSTAIDGDGPNSPFTAALVKNLGTPGLDVRLAFGRVRDEVLQSTRHKQEPFVYGSLGGATVALVPPPAEPKRADAAASEEMRRDYEIAERVGTREAWDSFLAAHDTGFFADLARSQRQKLAGVKVEPGKPETGASGAVAQPSAAKIEPPPAMAASQERKSEPAAPGAVAALSPTPPASSAMTAPPADSARIARELQDELNRVGCGSGAPDGHWGPGSRRALEAFNRHAGTALEVKMATLDAVDAVRGRTSRVCPLVCGRGFRVEGERCVAIACKPGYAIGADGECERRPEPKETKTHERHRPEERRPVVRERSQPQRQATGTSSTAGSSGSSGSGRSGGKILCTDRGCQSVGSNCHVEQQFGGRGNIYESVVCR
jgi:Caspase domain